MSDEPELPGQLEIPVEAPARWHRGPAPAEQKPAGRKSERKPDEGVKDAGRVVK